MTVLDYTAVVSVIRLIRVIAVIRLMDPLLDVCVREPIMDPLLDVCVILQFLACSDNDADIGWLNELDTQVTKRIQGSHTGVT